MRPRLYLSPAARGRLAGGASDDLTIRSTAPIRCQSLAQMTKRHRREKPILADQAETVLPRVALSEDLSLLCSPLNEIVPLAAH